MFEQVIIAIVVVVAIVAHVWLYKWVKFKMDEGVILQFMRDSVGSPFCSSQAISSHTRITVDRVSKVCSKSKAIQQHTQGQDSWCLLPITAQ